MKELGDKLLGLAVSLLVTALLFRWALHIVGPLTPWLILLALTIVVARWLWARRSAW